LDTPPPFDAYAEEYYRVLGRGLKPFGPDIAYYGEYKVRTVRGALSSEPRKILEYGCGIGINLPFFKKIFPRAEVWACDISPKSLEIAAAANPSVRCFQAGQEPPGLEGGADLVFIANLFHHILPEKRDETLLDIRKLLRPGGSLFIFEHNLYNLLTCKIVRQCFYDQDAVLLTPSEMGERVQAAGFSLQEKRYTLFFPALLKALSPAEKFLGWCALGGQYLVRAVRPS
jgi:SAM-dependent methyltransferase